MTPREHRRARKKWVAYLSDYRKKQKICGNGNKYMDQNTPPSSDEDNIPEVPIINNERRAKAKRRSMVQLKKINSIMKRKDLLVKLASEQQRNRRLKRRMMKNKKALSPKSKIETNLTKL